MTTPDATPRTDAALREAIAKHGRGEYADNEINADLTKFARTLERELAAARANLDAANTALGTLKVENVKQGWALQQAESANAQLRAELAGATRKLEIVSNKLDACDDALAITASSAPSDMMRCLAFADAMQRVKVWPTTICSGEAVKEAEREGWIKKVGTEPHIPRLGQSFVIYGITDAGRSRYHAMLGEPEPKGTK